ncbi:MAG: ATP-binding protein [Bryobacteraceae bacterium]|nr:ATP-binding protein [Bryobacteraceae bacterium]
MYSRHLDTAIETALTDTPAVFVNGARQTGKSTMVRNFGGEYLTFDDSTVLGAARSDLDAFVRGLPSRAVIDEVQRIPDLARVLKASIDRDRKPGRFILTGSANVMLLPRMSDSLAGRMEVLTLWPLSVGEIESRRETFLDRLFQRSVNFPLPSKRSGWLNRALTGGFPEAVSRRTAERRQAWFRSYLTTILERDVRDLANIEGLTAMPRLLTLLASRLGGLLNFASLSTDMAMPQTTLKRYLTLLETVFLIRLLPPWHTNLGLRLIKSPKLYLLDSGLAAHLSGATPEQIRTQPRWSGPLFENFIVMELTKQASWSKRPPGLFHYRSLAGQEVDILVESPAGQVVGIEVKAAASVGAQDFRGLKSLAEAIGKKFHRGIVLYAGDEAVAFGDRLWAVPWDVITG